MTILLILFLSGILSSIGVGIIRRIAIAKKMIDFPNERSSHEHPTPRGGGLSIVVIVLAGVFLFGLTGILAWNIIGAIWVGGLIALVGYIDDGGGLSPFKRIFIHFIAASVGIILLGGITSLDLGFTRLEWGFVGQILTVFGIVWMINLFNFMDGIDGLASSEAIFLFGVGGLMLANAGINNLFLLCMLYVGACSGFLWWNWPPAKIFMGDVASGFLGYLIAILAITSSNQGFSLWSWLILISVFFVDATITLLRRIIHGEKWYKPHRSHAYQHLARYWGSHLKVILAIMAVNILWLAPFAFIVSVNNDWNLVIVTVAILPLIWVAMWIGAGSKQAKIGRKDLQ